MRFGVLGMHLVFGVGCTFTPASSDETPATDAPPNGNPDAPMEIDAPRLPVCDVTTNGLASAVGFLGSGTDGGGRPDLVCPSGQLPIGFAFDITPTDPPGWLQEVVIATRLRCGTITRFSDNTYSTVAGDQDVFAIGPCGGFPQPINPGAELLCPQGMVVVGMRSNQVTGTNGAHTQFNTVRMQCAALDAAGAPTGVATTVTFTDTANHSDRPQSISCPAGEVAHHFSVTAGCGQDSLGMLCAPSACE